MKRPAAAKQVAKRPTAKQPTKQDKETDNDAEPKPAKQKKVEAQPKKRAKQASSEPQQADNEQQSKPRQGSKRRRSEENAGTEDANQGDEKNTFARRYLPKKGTNREKWIGLQDAYANHIAPKLTSPSKYEDQKAPFTDKCNLCFCIPNFAVAPSRTPCLQDHFYKFFTTWFAEHKIELAADFKCKALEIVNEYLKECPGYLPGEEDARK